MDLEFDADQEALRATVRRFLGERAGVAEHVRPALARGRWVPDEVWRGLGDLGALGLQVPTDHGGAGVDLMTAGVVLEELGRALVPSPYATSAVGAVWTMNQLASPDQQARWSPGLAAGTLTAAPAVDHSRPLHRSPPDISAEPAAADATGTADTNGATDRTCGDEAGTVAVTGAVDWVAHGGEVDLLLVPAALGSSTVWVVVQRHGPGVEVTGRDHVDVSAGFSRLQFRSARGTLLGPDRRRRGRGESHPAPSGAADGTTATPAALVDRVLVAWLAEAVGVAEAALERTVAYAAGRRQFGVPVGSFQAVQHLCADMLRNVETTRAVVYHALWAADAGDPTRAHRAATEAKAKAAEALPRVGAACIQVHGGIGFTWEHDAHLFHKRLLTVQHLFGTAEAHLDHLADLIGVASRPGVTGEHHAVGEPDAAGTTGGPGTAAGG